MEYLVDNSHLRYDIYCPKSLDNHRKRKYGTRFWGSDKVYYKNDSEYQILQNKRLLNLEIEEWRDNYTKPDEQWYMQHVSWWIYKLRTIQLRVK